MAEKRFDDMSDFDKAVSAATTFTGLMATLLPMLQKVVKKKPAKKPAKKK
jgi:hypothetical protein